MTSTLGTATAVSRRWVRPRQLVSLSNMAFGAGVTAIALVLLGTTTWAGDGFWAADGASARFIPTSVMLAWIAVVSGFLMRRPSTVSTPGQALSPRRSFDRIDQRRSS